jgi:dynein intermediate chain, cytosolic
MMRDLNHRIKGDITNIRYGVNSNQGVTERFQGHTAPVTGLDFRSTKGEIDFSDLFITSSLDWSCKLWSKKSMNYLYSFQDLGDCIYDCKWSPVHPALFASCDGSGHLNLWNLNSDVEVPYISQKVTNHSLNRVGWSCDGKKVACGDAEGVLHIYDVGEVSF